MSVTSAIIGIITATGLVFVAWHFVERKRFMSRRKLDDTGLLDLFVSADLDASKALVILKVVGNNYGIPYGVLRPDDRFDGNLWNLDVSRMGFGTMKLRTYLIKKFGFRRQIHFRPTSIDGLLRELAHSDTGASPEC